MKNNDGAGVIIILVISFVVWYLIIVPIMDFITSSYILSGVLFLLLLYILFKSANNN